MPALFVLPALAACLWAPPCSCILGPPITSEATAFAARNAASSVFVGVVQRIDDVPVTIAVDSASGRAWRSTDAIATVRVLRSWKGAVERTVVVRTASETTMCGASLRRGRSLLVFGSAADFDRRGDANPVQRGDTIYTSKCAPTTDVTIQIERIGELLGPPDSRSPEA